MCRRASSTLPRGPIKPFQPVKAFDSFLYWLVSAVSDCGSHFEGGNGSALPAGTSGSVMVAPFAVSTATPD